MADINIERRGPGVWPWIIGLLVLALLIWGLVEMFGNDGEPAVVDPLADTVIVDNSGAAAVPPVPGPAPGAPFPADTGLLTDTMDPTTDDTPSGP